MHTHIAPLLPEPKASPRGGSKAFPNRPVFEGILWVLRSGARWKDLPERYPSPSTCWRRLRDWEEQDVWLEAWCALCFQLFIEELSRTYADDFLLIVMDQAGSHLRETIVWPQHIAPLLLPLYSHELNPVERWFGALRATLSIQRFATNEALAQALTQALQSYWEYAGQLAQLTGFGSWCEATNNIRTSD